MAREHEPQDSPYRCNSRGVGDSAETVGSALGDRDAHGSVSTLVPFGRVENLHVVGSVGLYIANELK